MYLLDTNTCIFAINNESETTLHKIKSFLSDGLYISAITVAELEYGVENSSRIEQNRTALLKFLSIFNIISYTDKDSTVYGKMKARLRREGKMFGPLDMLIAGHALSRGYTIVTNNTREFRNVTGLNIEDWK